ncbi:MAG TPA: hypothetical protein VK589_10395 [Chryseolinea sp.]|nr:hypothetical protein [Chryseolinea sp.]
MTTWDKYTEDQKRICEKYKVPWTESGIELIIGLADNVLTGMNPVNGLRHPQCDRTTGWYIWAGEEWSAAEDFFKPHHFRHSLTLRPGIVKYLGLPPGFRFLIDDKGYEDVWQDPELLKI